MGGSGGGGFFSGRASPEDLAKRTRKAEEQSRDEVFEAEVEAFLGAELAQYNDRNVGAAQAVFEAVKHDLEKDIDGAVDLLYGGSIAKHTYVDGLSDVDALVLLDRTELAEREPRRLQQILAGLLRARYGRDAVSVGELAVTLTRGDTTIQLLPALRDGAQFRIASYNGTDWSRIDPTAFAKALTRANKSMDGKLVPCIKLVKAIVSGLPEKRRLTGYHVESLAIKIFRSYEDQRTPKAMVGHFFEAAPELVREPIRDSTGQSIHVDEYLGVSNSLERRTVADALGRVARRIRNADGARSIDTWKDLLG